MVQRADKVKIVRLKPGESRTSERGRPYSRQEKIGLLEEARELGYGGMRKIAEREGIPLKKVQNWATYLKKKAAYRNLKEKAELTEVALPLSENFSDLLTELAAACEGVQAALKKLDDVMAAIRRARP